VRDGENGKGKEGNLQHSTALQQSRANGAFAEFVRDDDVQESAHAKLTQSTHWDFSSTAARVLRHLLYAMRSYSSRHLQSGYVYTLGR
jgi:hypothetical protein